MEKNRKKHLLKRTVILDFLNASHSSLLINQKQPWDHHLVSSLGFRETPSTVKSMYIQFLIRQATNDMPTTYPNTYTHKHVHTNKVHTQIQTGWKIEKSTCPIKITVVLPDHHSVSESWIRLRLGRVSSTDESDSLKFAKSCAVIDRSLKRI